MTPPDPPPADVEALRADLSAAAYTVDTVDELLGPVPAGALRREQPLPAERALSARVEPAAVLARTFVLGQPATRGELDGALPRLGTDGASRLGLVAAAGAARGDQVRPLLDLRPYAAVDASGASNWWIVSDLGEVVVRSALRTDHVLGVGGASVTLAQATVRDDVGRVLDVGTGCGVQALHATRHARQVVATDVSRRALCMARLNFALAGATDVDLRRGSLLEPVTGESFDLVVSNPPFVITPRRRGVPAYDYRDGGLVGDGVVRELVTTVGGVLARGGTAQLLGNWEVRDDDWRQRVGRWVDESGLDGWVVQRELLDPAEYAETWIRDGGQLPGAEFDRLYGAWLDDFSSRGVTGIGFGLVVLRRPSAGAGPRWRRLEEQHGLVRQPLGAHLGRCLAARDLLAGMDDAALLASRWVVAPDVTEERHHRPGQADPAAIMLRQTDGFGRAVQVSTTVAAAVGACDGDLAVGQIAAALSHLLETGEGEVRGELLPAVRGLVADALLLPA